ncbi:PREDICTED: coiled-coil domain-containing protein 24 isoform X1 [Thamnophis sirtalis]|uniref:Coiled-coil domain-containing protein 24 isoform X1 n=1 Tax=Thamnophis sirtalis TaxID=35019 RepID=A0A6I9Y4W4_9SAUR|nr:PREDICTED: coiled-coil domain-containing protein 24 isoform X1 [Thamnophis sirtalis]
MLELEIMENSFSWEPLKPVPSLWRMIEEQLAPSERLEVKTILGIDLVDHSLELHDEVKTLLEFYQESQLDHFEQRPDNCILLAAPPHLKELVREEIRLLLVGLQQKALQEGRDHDCAIAKYNTNVINFAFKTNAGSNRPSSRSNNLIRSLSCSSPNDLEPYSDKLNITQIGEIASRLRTLLEEECHALERYIILLQNQLEEVHQHATEMQDKMHEPTMAELQEEKRVMEWDLQLSLPKSCPRTPSPMSNQFWNSTNLSQLSHLRGLVKGPGFGQINPASNEIPSPDPRDQISLLCYQPSSRWSPSTRTPLEWMHQKSEDSNQARKDSDTKLPTTLGHPTASGYRPASASAWEPAFLPMPPAEPCPPTRFCPRIRLLQCKGPS